MTVKTSDGLEPITSHHCLEKIVFISVFPFSRDHQIKRSSYVALQKPNLLIKTKVAYHFVCQLGLKHELLVFISVQTKIVFWVIEVPIISVKRNAVLELVVLWLGILKYVPISILALAKKAVDCAVFLNVAVVFHLLKS